MTLEVNSLIACIHICVDYLDLLAVETLLVYLLLTVVLGTLLPFFFSQTAQEHFFIL